MNQFDNFTPGALQVLSLARKEADRLHHSFVGTEHVLLGLIKFGRGVAINVLERLGIILETARMEIEQRVGTESDHKKIGNAPYTPRVNKILALAAIESKNLNHTYVGTEHILLGLLSEGEGVAARLLKSLDVNIEETRQEILKELDPNFEPSIRHGKPEGSIDVDVPASVVTPPTEQVLPMITPRGQQAIRLATEEAGRIKSNVVGTEHLLVGLISLGHGVAFQVMQKRGLDLELVRREVEKQAKTDSNPKAVGKIPYTPGIKKAFARAAKWAKRLNHTYVGTEHLLLGILEAPNDEAVAILKRLGVDTEQTRQEILGELDPNAGL